MKKNPWWKLLSNHFLGFSLCSCAAEEVFMKATDNFIANETENHKSKQIYIPPVSTSVSAMLGNRPKHFG